LPGRLILPVERVDIRIAREHAPTISITANRKLI
jgi:hypothetical protein